MITAKERRMEKEGVRWRKSLRDADMLLNPAGLGGLLPDYHTYRPIDDQGVLWVSGRAAHGKPVKTDTKLIVLISGPAGAGKDEVRRRLTGALPGQVRKLVTATSRPPREDEVHGRDYYFYDGPKAFQDAIDRGEFLEFAAQGLSSDGTLRLYGMPKQSIEDALAQPERILVSHTEMSGWRRLRGFVGKMSQSPSLLTTFVLPVMRARRYFDEWLVDKRPKDFNERGIRAGWEFAYAPKRADMLVINQVDDGETALARAAWALAVFIQGRFTAISRCQSAG